MPTNFQYATVLGIGKFTVWLPLVARLARRASPEVG